MTRIISIVGGLQPSTPTIGTATAGDTTASVAFTPSTYIGKGTITYTATSSPGGLTGTASSSPIAVTGLSNGTAYTFTVTGTTNYGVTSIASSASNSITPELGDTGSMFPLGAVTVSSAVASVTFSSIPSTYKHLQIRGFARSTVDTQLDTTFNSDGGSTYSYHSILSYGTGIEASGSANFTKIVMEASTNTASVFAAYIIDILDYANTNKYKTTRNLAGFDSNGGGRLSLNSGSWRNTNAITSITLTARDTTFTQYSSFALYGIKGA